MCLALIFGLSLNLSAQSNEKELDQAELLKQFIGTWQAESGKDSVLVIEFTPQFKGLYAVQENKADGKTYATYKGVIGLSDSKEMTIGAFIDNDGTMIFDIGKFVTKNKYASERYFGNVTHAATSLEWELTTPETFVARFKWRGKGMTWPCDWGWDITFRRID